MKRSIAQDPSALLPIVMSVTALLLVLWHIMLVGVARQADEGAEAYIWQMLMAGQVPVIAFFAIRWLLRAPSVTIVILALQVCAALAAMAPVRLLNW